VSGTCDRPDCTRPCRNGRDTGPCQTCYQRGRKAALRALRAGLPCTICGTDHRQANGNPACYGHQPVTHKPCRSAPIHGSEVCRAHGVNKNVRAAGERRVMEQEAARTLAQYVAAAEAEGIEPGEFLLKLLYSARARQQFYMSRALTLDDAEMGWGKVRSATGGQNKGDTLEAKPHFWIVQWEKAEQDAGRLCVDALKVGVLQRQIDLTEKMAERLMPILDAVLVEFQIDPSRPENAEKIEQVLRLVS
jgi:hypothetical protein